VLWKWQLSDCYSTAIVMASRVTAPLTATFHHISRDPVMRSLPVSPDESRRRVHSLYRKIVRIMPIILRSYEITAPTAEKSALDNIRRMLNANAALSDTAVIDVLRHKAEMEISEALLMHKTKSHLQMLIFKPRPLAEEISANRLDHSYRNRIGDTTVDDTPAPPPRPSPFLVDFLVTS